jgi:hypothetical protein
MLLVLVLVLALMIVLVVAVPIKATSGASRSSLTAFSRYEVCEVVVLIGVHDGEGGRILCNVMYILYSSHSSYNVLLE